MTSGSYVDTYLGIWCRVNGAPTIARVRNYLQSGKGAQSAHAQTARGRLLQGIQKLIGNQPGPTFDVRGDRYVKLSIDRVFMGKGSPDEIQDVIGLASLCGLLDTTTLSGYCDQNLGVDCGGFVANYWGMGHPHPYAAKVEGDTGISPRSFWNKYASLRRKAANEIQVDDAAIFFEDVQGNNPDLAAKKGEDGNYDKTSGSQAFHIGLVESIAPVETAVAAGSTAAPSGRVTLKIAESSGGHSDSGGNGVRIRSLGTVTTTVADKLVYCPDGHNRIYFVGRPIVVPPYMPNPIAAV